MLTCFPFEPVSFAMDCGKKASSLGTESKDFCCLRSPGNFLLPALASARLLSESCCWSQWDLMKWTDVLRAAALPLLSHAVPCACWPIVPGALLHVRKMCRDYGCLSAYFYWKIKSRKRLCWVPQPPPSTSIASPTLEHLVLYLLTWRVSSIPKSWGFCSSFSLLQDPISSGLFGDGNHHSHYPPNIFP